MQTNITLDFADGRYDFKLPWAACAEVERKSNAGIQVIYERLMIGQAHLSDVAEIIRQGLLGGAGGVVDEQVVECKPAMVNSLVDRYVTGQNPRPFVESWNLAKVVLHTFMQGYEPAQVGDSKKNEETDLTGST
ncbi:tail tube GTA-gp10-like protein [Novosphingobium sp. PhB165]|uniref:gene transfer agent family protein n=1 Tax=Novosphingobium sp. PhB165 TaxID=2485105 RepID=UPI0010D21FA9|nr:gene transfer agent family protein [Novosphingobium sp. PhB165]TCM21475.1 tail tube GTA-gp10-like protein [Novosphingobium sp. PhB165]